MKPPRACLECGAPGAGSRCGVCAKRREAERSQRRGPNGWERQRLAEAYLASQLYLCRLCGGRAMEVDHRRPRSEFPDGSAGDAAWNDRRNLQALCARCHKRKTAGERRR